MPLAESEGPAAIGEGARLEALRWRLLPALAEPAR